MTLNFLKEKTRRQDNTNGKGTANADHTQWEQQQTIAQTVNCTGVGVHSGSPVTLTLKSAPVDSGITFVRTDLAPKGVAIKASWENVVDTKLCTKLGNSEGVTIGTVEHLMAALRGCGIDNVVAEINGPEVPIMDGSSSPFIFLIECAGTLRQTFPRRVIEVLKEISVENSTGKATLSPCDHFALTFDFATPGRSVNIKQTFQFGGTKDCFKKSLSRARTFGFYEDVEYLRSAGLAQGGSLDNAVVIKDGIVMNEKGLRYDDEMVRHKALDAIGDLYLAGTPLLGHFHGECSGHDTNYRLLKELFSDDSNWRYVKVAEESANQHKKIAAF